MYTRFMRWTNQGVWERVLSALIEQDIVGRDGFDESERLSYSGVDPSEVLEATEKALHNIAPLVAFVVILPRFLQVLFGRDRIDRPPPCKIGADLLRPICTVAQKVAPLQSQRSSASFQFRP